MDDMGKYRIDDRTVDRLLSGGLATDDAPPGFGPVADVVRAALAPASPAELSREVVVVSMAAAVSAEAMSQPSPVRGGTGNRRREMISKVLTAKAAALATVAALGLGTAAAAATGNLPNQASSHASPTSVSASDISASNTTNDSKPTTSTIVINNAHVPLTGTANSHSLVGLCTAFTTQFAANSSSPSFTHSHAFKTLMAEIPGNSPAATNIWCGMFLSTVKPDNGTTTTSTPANPVSPGKSSSHSPVSTPNSGGTGTADDASGGASSPGVSIADKASDGASSQGSGNSSGH